MGKIIIPERDEDGLWYAPEGRRSRTTLTVAAVVLAVYLAAVVWLATYFVPAIAETFAVLPSKLAALPAWMLVASGAVVVLGVVSSVALSKEA